MQIASGKIVNGRVEIDAELPEGADVTLIALDDEETFEVTPELEAVILESIAQGRRGETKSCSARCAVANERRAANPHHRAGSAADS